MNACPFCAIVAGEHGATLLCETDAFLCFAPLVPEVPSHTLIVSRARYASLLDAPAALGASLPEVCRLLLQHFGQVQGSTAFNLLSANGTAAQQSVMHLHLHFLPRSDGDGIEAWPNLDRKT